jgi:Domain of unknown function (DUF4266)
MKLARASRFFGSRKALILGVFAIACTSCVTVRPQERAVLADPTMQFEGDKQASTPIVHAIENREGSYGGSGVSGGGCGCN